MKNIETLKENIHSIQNKNQSQRILENIKNIPMYGKADRGYANNVEIANISTYKNKNGKIVYEGPDKNIESCTDYLDELVLKHGRLCKETIGKIYWISTTKPNSSMSDPVTGISTGFQYITESNGAESLYFDACHIASTPAIWNLTKTKIEKYSGLRKIIETINPQSKLL